MSTSRAFFLLCLLLTLSARAAPLQVVEWRGRDGEGLELAFERLPPEPALARLSVEEARAFVVALEAEYQSPRLEPCHLVGLATSAALAGSPCGSSASARRSALERRVREGAEELHGASTLPLSSSLEDSPWFQALQRSPRYMGEGVRTAAMELLSSPTVAYSMALSMMLYMAAWAAPEPVFSKALATSVTIGLLMTYSAAELYAVGTACLTLYREAEAARTPEQLEEVARRFGGALGGVGLRVLVTVAGAKLARGLPEVPKGGMWARLSPPRFVLGGGGGARGGFTVAAGSRAQVSVANGTVLLMGVSANTAVSAVSASVAASRTTGACREESNKGDARGHHIATNKNDTAEVRGGPWTPLFEEIFEKAGMGLDDPANVVYLVGHQGPHPEAYHAEIYRRLGEALRHCRGKADCRKMLIEELDKIAGEICKPGAKLNKLLTKTS